MRKTKKILALILVFVFAFTTLATPVSAYDWAHDPDNPRYNNGGAEPEGDDTGWGDFSNSPGTTLETGANSQTTVQSLSFTCSDWVVCVLFHLGMFEKSVEGPLDYDIGNDNTDTRDTTESSSATRR